MMKNARRTAFTVVAALLAVRVGASEMDMRVFAINDHLTAFYTGRASEPPNRKLTWEDYAALNMGVATYAIHRGDRALVYDAFTSAALAQWVRDYLTKAGIKHFTLVNSHWHLDHTGGNAVYADADRIATDATIQLLAPKRAAIEAGTLWGPPAIKPFAMPNIGITADTTFYVGDIRVDLRPIRIHTEDGLLAYLPADRILLAGDTLDGTILYISEPEHIVEHYRNMRKLKQWDIDRILPNHGDPDVISHGGYPTTLIDANLDYVRKLILRSHDPDYTSGTLEDYIGDSVKKGWLTIQWAYRQGHQENLKKVAEALKDNPLPELPE